MPEPDIKKLRQDEIKEDVSASSTVLPCGELLSSVVKTLPDLGSIGRIPKLLLKVIPAQVVHLWCRCLDLALSLVNKYQSQDAMKVLYMVPMCVLRKPKRGGKRLQNSAIRLLGSRCARFLNFEFCALWDEAVADFRASDAFENVPMSVSSMTSQGACLTDLFLPDVIMHVCHSGLGVDWNYVLDMSGITKLHLVSALGSSSLPVSLARFVNLLNAQQLPVDAIWGSPFQRLYEAIREECSSVLPSNWVEFELKKHPQVCGIQSRCFENILCLPFT